MEFAFFDAVALPHLTSPYKGEEKTSLPSRFLSFVRRGEGR